MRRGEDSGEGTSSVATRWRIALGNVACRQVLTGSPSNSAGSTSGKPVSCVSVGAPASDQRNGP